MTGQEFPSGAVFIGICVLVVVIYAIAKYREMERVKKLSPTEHAEYIAERQRAAADQLWGPVNEMMICPHCQTKGKIRTKLIEQKAGVSGGKATGAILTGGLSLLATGLSRKQTLTEAHCGACNSTWHF